MTPKQGSDLPSSIILEEEGAVWGWAGMEAGRQGVKEAGLGKWWERRTRVGWCQ